MRRQEPFYFNINIITMCSTRILLFMFLRLFSELITQLLVQMALITCNIHVEIETAGRTRNTALTGAKRNKIKPIA